MKVSFFPMEELGAQLRGKAFFSTVQKLGQRDLALVKKSQESTIPAITC